MKDVLRIETPPIFWPLLKPSRYKGVYGGRASGKSHSFAELVIERCEMRPGTRIVCVREVQKSLKESVKLLLEDKIKTFGLESHFRVLSDSIQTPGNGVIVFQGMADHTADSIKSLEGFDVGYVEEAHTLTERSLELLRPTIRKDGSEIWFSWNPRHSSDPVDLFFRGPTPPENAIIIHSNYPDNPWFSEEMEAERTYDEKNNPARYAHIWLGEYEPQAVGAIWNRDVFHRNRKKEAPELSRILVSIDPPISSTPGSDEAGIIVVGIGTDKRGYVIADVSTHGTPQQWAEKAVAAYDLYEADAMVAEINQGGEMVTNTIHSVRKSIRVIPVRATRGKHIRAEPISALYALDRISHVGTFPKLEAQCCLMTAEGYEGDGSPDRLDAMVWGFTELFPKLVRRERPKNMVLPTRTNNRYDVHRAHRTR